MNTTPTPTADPIIGQVISADQAGGIFIIVCIVLIIIAAVSGNRDGGTGDGWR